MVKMQLDPTAAPGDDTQAVSDNTMQLYGSQGIHWHAFVLVEATQQGNKHSQHAMWLWYQKA